MVDVWNEVRKYMASIDKEDKIEWTLTKTKRYSIVSAWDAFREVRSKVSWGNLIWKKLHIPRQSFVVWLAVRNRLATRSR